ncbi:MAG: malonyl-ACP O-methyltransferase BioC [Proteobacteria bacterium]|nr:malonyl-ACP O-methyltransferase BioC [Pseudomonadota bacterium]
MQNSIDNDYSINTKQVRCSFNSSAEDYDAFSVLQRTVSDRLIEGFDEISIKPSFILDLGSGTGYATGRLKKLFKKSFICQLDISDQMLKQSKRKPAWFKKNYLICADAMQIPLPDDSIDIVFSNLMLQWCHDIDAVFAEVNRVLKTGGVFIFSSFGPDTLKELRESWLSVDDSIHVNAFIDMHDVGDSAIRNGLDAPVLSVEHIVLTYDDCWQLMHELKKIGSHNINSGRRKTMTGKTRLQKMIHSYESFRQENKLPATYEVIYGHAWQTGKKANVKMQADTQYVSLNDLKQNIKTHKPGKP